jgi:integrase
MLKLAIPQAPARNSSNQLQPFHPDWFTRTWGNLYRAAGVPAIELHDGRYMSATVGAEAGVGIKTMQARLGHSDPAILTRIYLAPFTFQSAARLAAQSGGHQRDRRAWSGVQLRNSWTQLFPGVSRRAASFVSTMPL